jgi:hypothetical protein
MARTQSAWVEVLSSYLKTIYPAGLDILINGVNHYLNFGTFSGSSGYGFRDNAGTMEVKNDGGTWNPIASTTSGLSSEVPSGTIDGVNTNFLVAHSPKLLFLNGAFQTPSIDYTLSGSAPTITISYVTAPPAGTHLSIY